MADLNRFFGLERGPLGHYRSGQTAERFCSTWLPVHKNSWSDLFLRFWSRARRLPPLQVAALFLLFTGVSEIAKRNRKKAQEILVKQVLSRMPSVSDLANVGREGTRELLRKSTSLSTLFLAGDAGEGSGSLDRYEQYRTKKVTSSKDHSATLVGPSDCIGGAAADVGANDAGARSLAAQEQRQKLLRRYFSISTLDALYAYLLGYKIFLLLLFCIPVEYGLGFKRKFLRFFGRNPYVWLYIRYLGPASTVGALALTMLRIYQYGSSTSAATSSSNTNVVTTKGAAAPATKSSMSGTIIIPSSFTSDTTSSSSSSSKLQLLAVLNVTMMYVLSRMYDLVAGDPEPLIRVELQSQERDMRNFRPPPNTLQKLVDWPLRVWQPPVFFALDRIPRAKEKVLFVGNHCLWALDCPTLIMGLWQHERIWSRVLGEHAWFAVPGMREMAQHLAGVIDGTPNNCGKMMAAGANILVFPGGARESWKTTTDQKYALMWDRKPTGFAKLAIKHGYTVVPVASVGSEDAWRAWYDFPLGRVMKRLFPAGSEKQSRAFKKGICLPFVRPGRPQRVYFWFGQPLRAGGTSAAGEVGNGRDQEDHATVAGRPKVLEKAAGLGWSGGRKVDAHPQRNKERTRSSSSFSGRTATSGDQPGGRRTVVTSNPDQDEPTLPTSLPTRLLARVPQLNLDSSPTARRRKNSTARTPSAERLPLENWNPEQLVKICAQEVVSSCEIDDGLPSMSLLPSSPGSGNQSKRLYTDPDELREACKQQLEHGIQFLLRHRERDPNRYRIGRNVAPPLAGEGGRDHGVSAVLASGVPALASGGGVSDTAPLVGKL